MKFTAEQWTRYEASNAKRRKKSATLREMHKHVQALRVERRARAGGDALGKIKPADKLAMLRRIAAYEAEKSTGQHVRTMLLGAERIARETGFVVRSSKDREGAVSSFYAETEGRKVRISDHHLPQNAKREAQADFHGGSAFAAEIIIDAEMTETRLRRLIVLAKAGRV